MNIVDNPTDLLNHIVNIENAYLIKIKCIACSECGFIKYKNPIIKNDLIIIGEYSYPFNLIETITIRCKDCYRKTESKYKVSNNYLKQLLNDETIKELLHHKLM